jgi:hypothetical protein
MNGINYTSQMQAQDSRRCLRAYRARRALRLGLATLDSVMMWSAMLAIALIGLNPIYG